MSLNFSGLPKELHLEISAYLPWSDNKSLSQCSNSLRQVYHAVSWKNCVIANSIFDFRRFPVSQNYRPVHLNMMLHPKKYSSWFLSKAVEKIMFYKESMALVNGEISHIHLLRNQLQSTNRVYFVLKENYKLTRIILKKFEGINIVIASVKDSYYWEFNGVNRVLTKLFYNTELERDYARFVKIVPQLSSNITKFSLDSGGYGEKVIKLICDNSFPVLQDFSFELFIVVEPRERTSIISNYCLNSISQFNDMPFIKKLKYFEIALCTYTPRELPTSYYYESVENLWYTPNGTVVPKINLPCVTHLKMKSYDFAASNIDFLNEMFIFPNVKNVRIVWSLYTGKLKYIDGLESLFSNLTYLNMSLKLVFLPSKHKFSAIDNILALKSLTELKALKVDLQSDFDLGTAKELFVMHVGRYHDTLEGSVYSQVCKIFKESQKLDNFSDNEELVSKTLYDIIVKEFHFIIAPPNPNRSHGIVGKNDFETMSMETQETIRGFFIFWLGVLLQKPDNFCETFSDEFHKLCNSLTDSDSQEDTPEEKEKYREFGAQNELEKFKTRCNLSTIAEFFFHLGVTETLFSVLVSNKKLEYFQVTTGIDLTCSPRLEYFIQNQKSLKQVSIISPILQPYDSMILYLNNFWTRKYVATYIRDEPEKVLRVDEIKKIYKLDLGVGRKKACEKPSAIEYVDPIIFPEAPPNGRREIFWDGLIATCLDESIIGVRPTPFGIRSYVSEAHVLYELNRPQDKFHKNIDIGLELGQGSGTEFDASFIIEMKMTNDYNLREDFCGWF